MLHPLDIPDYLVHPAKKPAFIVANYTIPVPGMTLLGDIYLALSLGLRNGR